jgi:hypothetical protein
MFRMAIRLSVSLLLLAGSAAVASAQASIAGTVKDASGAILPGVTVEAASPALIEKVRSVVSDGTGQYAIVDLRPGTYTVTFSLTGFRTVKREGIELAGSFTAAVNAEMSVGTVEETITVTGESPTVDLQTATRQKVLTVDVIGQIPVPRTLTSVATLIPGTTGNTSSGLAIHGGRSTDQKMVMDGLSIGLPTLTGGAESLTGLNLGGVQEVAVDLAAVSADTGQGGVRVNIIPKEGGNVFRGSFFGQIQTGGMQGSNYSDALKAAGLASAAGIQKIWDFNPGYGGPIVRERLWFYGTMRYNGNETYVPSMFYNLNAGNPNAWTYVPDTSRPVTNSSINTNGQIRLTWQAAVRDKVSFAFSQSSTPGGGGISATTSPEARAATRIPIFRTMSANWSSPVTSRLLLDAAGYQQFFRYGAMVPSTETLNPLMIPVTDQATGLSYRSAPGASGVPGAYTNNALRSLFYRAAVSYITGAHSFKVGFSNGFGQNSYTYFDMTSLPVAYRFNNGVPNQITEKGSPISKQANLDSDLGLYAQDRWTVKRLTLGLGIRLDYFKASYPDQVVGPGPLVPGRNLSFAAGPALTWKDVTPKLSVAYDLFGTGKTAVKASLNKYVTGQGLQGLVDLNNPSGLGVLNVTRSWTDANKNFIPDCNLVSPLANDECGAMSNSNFGNSIPGTTVDPKLLNGWGVRGYNWEFSAGVQHELLPRVAVDAAFFRRLYGNFVVNNNLALNPSNFSPFSVTAPVDARLPGGGGYVISGLYNVNPAQFSVPANNYVTLSDTYGNQTEHWNGADFTVTARPKNLTISGGVSMGRVTSNSCALPGQGASTTSLSGTGLIVIPTANPSTLYCDYTQGLLTQAKVVAVYTLERPGVQISGSYQSVPGSEIAANYVATNAVVQPSLGRPLSGGAANVTVNLVEPGTMYGARQNNLDLRVSKILTFGRTRSTVGLDILNVFNSATILSQSSAYATWLAPQSIPQPRAARIGVQVDF